MTAPPSWLGDPRVVERLREVLASAEYTDPGIRAVLQAPVGAGLGPLETLAYRRRLRTRDPSELLVSLFVLGDPVAAADAEGVLDVDGLVRIGMLERLADEVRSPLVLIPFDDLIIAGERDDPLRMGADHVPSLHAITRSVANLTVPAGGETLDVGTGSGGIALAVASRSAAVTGTDISARALAFASLNAVLNGVANVSWQQGSWYEPVAGRTFDTVVCNPPFVLGPDDAFTYRDAGPNGSDVTRQALEGACAVLREGGCATVIGNWAVPENQEWWEVPAAWAGRADCDMWVVHHATFDPLSYAATWNEPLGAVDPAAYEAELDRWVEAHQRADIRTIAAGTVIVRRHAAARPSWFRSVTRLAAPGPAASAQIQRMFAGVDVLADLGGDAAILDRIFRPVDGQQISEQLIYEHGAYATRQTRLAIEDGVGFSVEVDPRVLAVLVACDGSRTVRDLVAVAAQQTGWEQDDCARETVSAMRELTEAGLLVLAG